MSKLFDYYAMLKSTNSDASNVLYLFKSGIFFICIDEDAKKASSLLNLKLTNLNNHVVKCGFPINSLYHYSNLLKLANYEFKIIDTQKQTSFSVQNYSIEENTHNLLLKLSNTNSDTLSIKEAYSLIEELKQESIKILSITT